MKRCSTPHCSMVTISADWVLVNDQWLCQRCAAAEIERLRAALGEIITQYDGRSCCVKTIAQRALQAAADAAGDTE